MLTAERSLSEQAELHLVAHVQGDVDAVFRHLLENKRAGDCRDVVVCGSLYLCSDVLRYIASA